MMNIGGYDYQFVEQEQDVNCVICQLPCKEAYLSNCCGQLYCKSCLEQFKLQEENLCCPMCKKNFNAQVDKKIDRKIRSLEIYCPNKEDGCAWKGEINNLKKHLNFGKGCDIECKVCKENVHHKIMKIHKYECPCYCIYCHATSTREIISNKHKKKCSMFPLPCPNTCGQEIIPCNINQHRKECPYEVVQCKYVTEGCRIRMKHKNQNKHITENLEYHLQLQTKRLRELNETIYHNKILLVVLFLVFFIGLMCLLFHMQTKVLQSNIKLNNTVHLLKSYEIRNHIMWVKEIYLSAESSSSSNKETPVTFVIPGVNKYYSTQTEWYSSPFYAFKKGYKVCLRVDPYGYGDNEGTHVSVFMYLMKGPYDKKLHWPLRGTFTIQLLNYYDDTEHHIHTVSLDYNTCQECTSRINDNNTIASNGWGVHAFITHKDLVQRNFIYDGSLFFRVLYDDVIYHYNFLNTIHDFYLFLYWLMLLPFIKLFLMIALLLPLLIQMHNYLMFSYKHSDFVLVVAIVGYLLGMLCGVNSSRNLLTFYIDYYLIEPIAPGILALLVGDLVDKMNLNDSSTYHLFHYVCCIMVGNYVVGSTLGGLIWSGLTIMVGGIGFHIGEMSTQNKCNRPQNSIVGATVGYMLGGLLSKILLVNVLSMPWGIILIEKARYENEVISTVLYVVKWLTWCKLI